MAVVIPFIGAAIGGAIGGSFLGIGAATWGYFAGSLLASAIFKPPGQEGPRLEDLTIVGTDYGQTIPWVAGSPRLAPQYIWVSDLREIPNTQKVGKGGSQKVTTYTYECDVLVILTENVTEGVARDWVNSELIRNGLTTKEGVWAAVTVYTGEEDQLPDPIYEAAVVDAPAYRGHTTVHIQGLQLGGGKQLPNLEHQISEPVFGRNDLIFYAPFDSDFNDHSDYAIGANIVNSVSPAFTYQLVDGLFNSGLGYSGSPSATVGTYVSYTNSAYAVGTDFFTLGFWIKVSAAPTGNIIFWMRRSDANLDHALEITTTATSLRLSVSGAGNVDAPLVLHEWHYVATSRGASGRVKFYVDGVFIGELNTPAAMSNTNTLVLHGNPTSDRHADAVLDDVFVIAGADLYPAAFTPPVHPMGAQQRNPYLSEVLVSLFSRAGYSASEYYVDPALNQEVNGYAAANVTSTRAHLETLRPFGLYEANCCDKVYVFPRAESPAGVIPWEDLGVSETPGEVADPFPLVVGNEVEVPAQIAVRYRNISADWNTGTEFADRGEASSLISTQTVDVPFGLTPAQAKKIADTILKDAIAGLGRATLRVGGRRYAKYVEGDVLTTTAPDGTGYRFRIITKRDYIFMLEWEVALDDASALTSPAITFEGYVPTTDPLRVAPTDWEVLAIPALQDSDAGVPGPYVAITPARDDDSDEWPGAVFVRARLPEAFEQVFISGDAAVMGACQTTLGDFGGGSTVLDWTQKLRVRVRGELASSNYYDFFADRTINAAVVGDEPIRFMRADFVSTDGQFSIYDLSGLMRGQLGQEHLIGEHEASERFVLLSTALRRMANQTTDIGQEHQVKAVTLNTLLSNVTDEDFTDDGIALRPYSPVALQALAQTSGDLSVEWVRRSRLVARYTDQGVFAPLGEAAESYRVKIYGDPDAAPVRTEDTTTPAYTYAAADIASDGFSSGDPITITVQQLSETVGEGFAVTLEVEAP